MIKKNRIFIKFFIAMFLVILFFSTLFSVYYIKSQEKGIIKSMEMEAKSIAKMIIYVTSDAIVLDNSPYIVEFNYDLLSHNTFLKNIIINEKDEKYYILKTDSWSFKTSLDKQLKEEEKEVETSKIMYSPILKKEVFHYTQPIIITGSKWGHIHLSFTLEEYNKKLENMYYSFLTFFLILLFIISIISYFIAKSLASPIVDLNNLAKNISKGDLKLRSNYSSDDEIGQLSNSFNEMISTIEKSQLQLKESHENLEVRVNERTMELYKANEELENKTLQLEELNQSLDKKVKDEVDKRTNQEKILIQQSRLAAMGELISNIAHQWRQPLSVISTAASGIKVEKEFGILDDESEIERIDTIVDTSNYLSSTIENLSRFFSLNKTKTEFLAKDKIEQALQLIDSTFRFHRIDVKKDIEENLKVFGFANEYGQIVMNILTNAKDVLVERDIQTPKIILKAYRDENWGILEVEDNANGIDKSIIDKIFDPYFTTKHKSQGVGTGLYMSKMIIEKSMNGKLYVENTPIGAKFTIKVELKNS